MSRKHYMISMALVLALVLSAGGASAQDGGPTPQDVGAQAALGTAFTYQGRLTDGGNPANGTYDLEFKLYDAASLGNLVGSPNTVTINDQAVSNGLFTVPLDFGSSAFSGDARWLEIGVRPGSSTGSYTALTPRQPLTAAPYALALPGLYTQQNVTSPNLIGGYSGNSVTAGVAGATIGGGGESGITNRVTDIYGTVGGGANNRAGDDAGATNDKGYATVAGGFQNVASGQYAAIGGGTSNTASGNYTAVDGGIYNSASNNSAAIGGGQSNTASGSMAAIGGGQANTASAAFSSVGGGQFNTAGGSSSTVSGGQFNTASFAYATVPGGYYGNATHYGQMAHASGKFVAAGDAQTSIYVLRRSTVNATPADLFLDGGATPQRLTLPITQTVAFDGLVVARTSAGASAGYQIQGLIENVGGTTAIIGAPTVTVLGEDDAAWDVTVVADNTNDALVIRVTGAASTTIYWVATLRTVEVMVP